MHIFYTPDINGQHYSLDAAESKHCSRVLRLKNGDVVYLVDGRGVRYKAVIVDANPKATIVEVIEKEPNVGVPHWNLHIGIAPTKNTDRFEWFLEKATEIGIETISPLLCENSERKQIKPERLQKVLVAAMKQSLRAKIPELSELKNFSEFINTVQASQKFIAHCYSYNLPHLKSVYAGGSQAVVLIGPEGDFSQKEVELAKNAGFVEISLGKSRLRTETAAIVAVNTVAFCNS